ncbi:MAG: DUF2330 domain-containing protein [bacterium]|nr:DUF2330 domain-containing protein [bacterium]
MKSANTKPSPSLRKRFARAALIPATFAVLLAGVFHEEVRAFCGFYVARADTKLYNQASRVVLVRDGDRTVLTMANDYQGEPKDFALVVPVPTFIERGQINVADPSLIDHLDAYSAPRLVEYFDEDPCNIRRYERMQMRDESKSAPTSGAGESDLEKSTGVTVEAQYQVDEYDIVILSAKESNGLERWLTVSGYKIPNGASRVLGSYIKQDMRFFVAKVNLEKQSKNGFSYLRPLQVAYESPKFMLPIRLGTLNAKGPQDLFVFALTKNGRVETSNYRTVRMPTGQQIPAYVKNEFSDFYRDMFSRAVQKENMRAVFLEYAWDMRWCDPCAADPLSAEQLRKLGVFWIDAPNTRDPNGSRIAPGPGGAQNAFVTRLHVRYTGETFPEDLVFQETADRANFQGRYVLRHAYKGGSSCSAADSYRRSLPARYEKEAQSLAGLTGWNINDIRQKMGVTAKSSNPYPAKKKWWEQLW